MLLRKSTEFLPKTLQNVKLQLHSADNPCPDAPLLRHRDSEQDPHQSQLRDAISASCTNYFLLFASKSFWKSDARFCASVICSGFNCCKTNCRLLMALVFPCAAARLNHL